MIKAYDVATIRALEAQAIEEVGADAMGLPKVHRPRS